MLRPITAQARASPSRPIAGLREELALSVMDPPLRCDQAAFERDDASCWRHERRSSWDEASHSRHERAFSRDEAALSGDKAPSRKLKLACCADDTRGCSSPECG